MKFSFEFHRPKWIFMSLLLLCFGASTVTLPVKI